MNIRGTLGEREVSIYRLTAVNFAESSSNKIHSDAVAKRYGFKGGLVPGIALYAYMAHPVVERLGIEWLMRGRVTAKFIKPVYEGDPVEVRADPSISRTDELEIQVFNADGTLCAVGQAELAGQDAEAPKALDYPLWPLPAIEERMAPRAADLPAGTPFGTVNFHPEADGHESKVSEHYLDNLAIYKGPEARCHPAYLLAQANQILMRNVNLGPWIHTQSRVQNFVDPGVRDRLSIRGRVARSYEKRGHELVDLDLAVFDSQDHGIARIQHTAIVRLKSRSQSPPKL
jgi:hypothetical protein